jgi:hypothetical protein
MPDFWGVVLEKKEKTIGSYAYQLVCITVGIAHPTRLATQLEVIHG